MYPNCSLFTMTGLGLGPTLQNTNGFKKKKKKCILCRKIRVYFVIDFVIVLFIVVLKLLHCGMHAVTRFLPLALALLQRCRPEVYRSGQGHESPLASKTIIFVQFQVQFITFPAQAACAFTFGRLGPLTRCGTYSTSGYRDTSDGFATLSQLP